MDTDYSLMSPIAVTAVILAGGQARRMHGADKGLLPVAGQPLIEHLLATLRGQVHHIVISANRNLARYATYGVPVFADETPEAQGPLAGIYHALCRSETEYVLTVPCDTPRLPPDLAQRMATTMLKQQASVCVARDGSRLHPVVALMPCALAADLRSYLDAGNRKVENWLQRHAPAIADFSDLPGAFVNLNTPDDCRALEKGMTTALAC